MFTLLTEVVSMYMNKINVSPNVFLFISTHIVYSYCSRYDIGHSLLFADNSPVPTTSDATEADQDAISHQTKEQPEDDLSPEEIQMVNMHCHE